MLTNTEIYSIATKLLKQYGSRSGILRHTEELIAEYGRADYIRISYAAKDIRDTTGLGKVDPAGNFAKKQPQLPKRLRDRYVVGERYEFTALGRQDNMGLEMLVDSYGESQSVKSSSTYASGDIIKCTVIGAYSKLKPSGKKSYKLRLSEPRRQRQPKPNNEPDEPIKYIKRPSEWCGEVMGLGKHKCGKPFTCSCCGRDFPANKGVRIDFKEIYFCNACKKLIYEPSNNGWSGSIITTPMGNKR